MPIIRLKRGTAANIEAATLQVGEPAFATDTDELYIGTATGKVKFAKSPHGNEAHSPDFLAVDGSNSPTADINWNNQRIRKAFSFPVDDPHWDWGVERIENNFLFHADKRWTVTVSTSPYEGSVSDLFTASPDEYVKWYNSDLPVTIEVDFGGAQHFFVAFGFSAWGSDHIPKDFKIEIYRTDTSTWETVADVTGNTQWCYLKFYATNYVGKIKWTITAVNSGDLWLSELIALHPSSKVEDKWPFLPLDATRDIDAYMSGNKWLSVATSGIVGLPRQSSSCMYLTTEYTVSASTTTQVPLDAILYDVQSECDTTNHRWTCTEDGIYLVNAAIKLKGGTVVSGGRYALFLEKNGSHAQALDYHSSNTGWLGLLGAIVLQLTTGDYLELLISNTTDSSVTVYGGTTYDTYLAVHKLA